MIPSYLETILYFTGIILLFFTLLLAPVIAIANLFFKRPAMKQMLWRGYKVFCLTMLVVLVIIAGLLLWLTKGDISSLNEQLAVFLNMANTKR